MKGTLHPARGSVQCPAPACGHHCLLSISEAVTCRDVYLMNHDVVEGESVTESRPTAVSAPDQLLIAEGKGKILFTLYDNGQWHTSCS